MPSPDATLLSWITAEINLALTVVRNSIAKFMDEPWNPAVLGPCPDHLHQVSGALRMVGLSGATQFCEALEGSFSGASGTQPTSASIGIIDRGVLALRDFVDGLGRGQANVPLRLFPEYRELASLQGKPDRSEKDLFFPDLSPRVPPHPRIRSLRSGELRLLLAAQRAQFQRGLLAWLRGQTSGFADMRQALNGLHQVAPQLPEPQAMWWAAEGLIDALGEPPHDDWLASAKALCNRIDFRMRDLAAGSQAEDEPLLREMLYCIAKCKSVTPRIKEIRQLYQLESLFPEPSQSAGVMEFDMDWLEPALYDMHSRLEVLKGAWVQYVSGEQTSPRRVQELVVSFRGKAAELGNQHFLKLLDAIALVSKHLPDPYPRQNQFMVIEMACAFLLVEHVIDHFTSPPADLGQQIAILGGWLLDSAEGKSTGEPPRGLRADLVQQIGVLQLRAQVAKEIVSNLQHVEQVLDAFARDPAKRDTLAGLKPHLRQIHGALVVLRFERAAEVESVCELMIAECAGPGHAHAAEDMDWIAEGLSSLGFFLDPCLHGREPAERALELFFSRFAKREVAPAPARAEAAVKFEVTASAEPAPAPADAAAALASAPPPRSGVDQELLGVFLDEANEVLRNIGDAVPLCSEQPHNLDALTTIRRGFHTLKGSGRMVGLMDLGEVAWEIEQVMNHWLKEKRQATPALLELVTSASAAFANWVAQLRGGTGVNAADAQDIVAQARRVKEGEVPVAAPQPDEVTIGDTRLARNFFEIYAKEAIGHITALEAEFGRWRSAPGAETSHEFMRAAHTLGSSSRTAGFSEIANLAAAVEQWVPFARQVAQPADVDVLQAAVTRLRAMVDCVVQRKAPGDAEEEARLVRELIARLEANPPPPVESAAPARIADARNKRLVHDDIDEQLLPVFLDEAQELVPKLGADLRAWNASPGDESISHSLRRALHTLKGSARMAGAIRLGELVHAVESGIEAAIQAGRLPADSFADLEEKIDRLMVDVERLRGGPPKTAQPPAAAVPQAEEPAQPEPQGVEPPAVPVATAMLRVNADKLDRLINDAGEVSIARSRVETELRVIKLSLADLGESIARMRSQLREVEIQADSQMQSRLSVLEERRRRYDPLEFDRYTRLQELTRLMAESLNDVDAIQRGVGQNLSETDAALLHQARTSRDVQQELMRMRAVPFSSIGERLNRIVRQTARELDKKAELEIEGAQVELDRSVLERIGAPLEHMVRNALAHGLEAPAVRAAAGKPESGRIVVTLRQERNEIDLSVVDDGAGIDLQKLHRKAIEAGIVDRVRTLTDAECMQLVFSSGLSTADTITRLSGRGIGMDVVRNEITSIGGRVDVASTRGKGTSFTIFIPLTLAVTQAVLVRAGSRVLAVSSAMVEQVLRLKADAMAAHYAQMAVEFEGRSYPLHSLQHLLGVSRAVEVQSYNSVLLVRSGIQYIALHVDKLVANQEIVVKNIGPQLARAPGVVGATVLADGGIVLIVNPVALAERGRSAPAGAAVGAVVEAGGPAATAAQGSGAAAGAPIVMVVDDSLTVRKVTSRLLEREGYQVITAKDGVDALERMKDVLPAVMLVDIEMPRMDGFELTRSVRGDSRTSGIPIIIISSRTAEKHRSHAASLGVNAFLGKPFQELELLRCVGGYADIHAGESAEAR